jgi:tetratricopeptide (TPR) repeat protein
MRTLLVLIAVSTIAAAEGPSKVDSAKEFLKQWRATGDASLLDRAEEPLKGFADFEADKIRVEILLAKEEFTRAVELASALNRKMPDDPHLYASLTDAYLALGDYARAEKEAQFLVDLRRASPAAFLRGAQLREVFGDTAGAMEWYTQAYRLISANDAVERGRVLAMAARMNTRIGRFDLAEKYLKQALSTAPKLPAALAALAELRLAEGKKDEAADTARLLPVSPRALGLVARATGSWDAFAEAARASEDKAVNANRDLALYYADVAGNPAEALRIASKEYARRKDISTADAYAWALFKAGQANEARKVADEIVKLGTKDSGVADHVAAIRAAGAKGN